ncbi:RsiV family protein [Neopusillimonas maritima]|uniref:DUF3298 domain-containing protein n=1 Tax=Neopusillimonas maritima TaxID=2026239 RepID=A0A3A1YYY2_9BURK|nr:RsiV family protein [Neopusillimonas maritima]RIY41694.1 hypothetical protein CJP73_04380 [Neopusillimonas maritima]
MKGFFSRTHPASAILACLILAGCASSPSNISLIPADKVASQTEKEGLFTQPAEWEKTRPGCEGECPTITVKSLVFPGVPVLTDLVDHALAMMTGVSAERAPGYTTIAGFESYFWQTAGPRDEVILNAKTRYRNRHLTVIELDSWQYLTGAAHGIAATQFLNWDNAGRKVLGIRNVLQPNQYEAYVKALRRAHQRWLEAQPAARENPAEYNRLWPFQPSDNYAFTDTGLVVKYDSYAIAPYSSGQPELLIPYSELRGVLRPEFIPAETA